MRKLVPILLALLGLLVGGGAGYLFRPEPEEISMAISCGEVAEVPEEENHDTAQVDEVDATVEYVKLNNQFVVPVVENDDVAALVILSISLEVSSGMTETVFAREPKLRDAFLRVLFDHANAGGFRGEFTQSSTMEILRQSLLEVARKTMGSVVSDVLIIDLVRQDS